MTLFVVACLTAQTQRLLAGRDVRSNKFPQGIVAKSPLERRLGPLLLTNQLGIGELEVLTPSRTAPADTASPRRSSHGSCTGPRSPDSVGVFLFGVRPPPTRLSSITDVSRLPKVVHGTGRPETVTPDCPQTGVDQFPIAVADLKAGRSAVGSAGSATVET